MDKEEFRIEAKKLFERSKKFKVLYDAEVYLVAMIDKIRCDIKSGKQGDKYDKN